MCIDRPIKFVGLGLLASTATGCAIADDGTSQSAIQLETLVQSSSAWDATPYTRYPEGEPLISVLRVTIAPHTTLE
jgi:hypothetical protein